MTLDAQMQRLEGLLAQLSTSSDPAAQVASREVVALLLELHRDGLQRLLDVIQNSKGKDVDVGAACMDDPVLSCVLLLHGLHPLPLAMRVHLAVNALPGVVACDLREGVVIVRIELVPPHSPGALVKAVEDALVQAAPDAVGVQLVGPAAAAAAGLVTLGKRAS